MIKQEMGTAARRCQNTGMMTIMTATTTTAETILLAAHVMTLESNERVASLMLISNERVASLDASVKMKTAWIPVLCVSIFVVGFVPLGFWAVGRITGLFDGYKRAAADTMRDIVDPTAEESASRLAGTEAASGALGKGLADSIIRSTRTNLFVSDKELLEKLRNASSAVVTGATRGPAFPIGGLSIQCLPS